MCGTSYHIVDVTGLWRLYPDICERRRPFRHEHLLWNDVCLRGFSQTESCRADRLMLLQFMAAAASLSIRAFILGLPCGAAEGRGRISLSRGECQG